MDCPRLPNRIGHLPVRHEQQNRILSVHLVNQSDPAVLRARSVSFPGGLDRQVGSTTYGLERCACWGCPAGEGTVICPQPSVFWPLLCSAVRLDWSGTAWKTYPLWEWLLSHASSSLWSITARAHRSRRGVGYRAPVLQGRIDWRGRLHLASAVVKSSVFHFSSFQVQVQGVGPHISSGLSKKSSRKTCSPAMAQHMRRCAKRQVCCG